MNIWGNKRDVRAGGELLGVRRFRSQQESNRVSRSTVRDRVDGGTVCAQVGEGSEGSKGGCDLGSIIRYTLPAGSHPTGHWVSGPCWDVPQTAGSLTHVPGSVPTRCPWRKCGGEGMERGTYPPGERSSMMACQTRSSASPALYLCLMRRRTCSLLPSRRSAPSQAPAREVIEIDRGRAGGRMGD